MIKLELVWFGQQGKSRTKHQVKRLSCVIHERDSSCGSN